MNRKDFDTLARAFKAAEKETGGDWETVVRIVSSHLAQDNANFDEKKFLERCGL